jgi:N-acetyl-1-D-myo-inositol-2-amino-2-deoxy-alpha-D-glucopyranoside deacetylase
MEQYNKLSKRILLAVLAHPDDESFGMGGTLAYYSQQGVEVHLVCATRGEAGTVDPENLVGFDSVADLRESELRCAASSLGLAGVHFLDYRDSGMSGSPDNGHPDALAAQPTEEVATRIVQYIRKLKPQVVVTFDPIGGYKHPDHIAIHKATVMAFEQARCLGSESEDIPNPPQKLYFHIFPKKMLKLYVCLMPLLGQDPRHYGRNKDIDLLSLSRIGDFPIHARISYQKVQLLRAAASTCHESQLPGGFRNRGLFRWLSALAGRRDYFMRAFPPVEKKMGERDLFAGL